MLKVTVGITTYNVEKYIAQCLDSILMQKTNFDFKILVVDDASTDKTQEILRTYQKQFPQKIELIFQKENKGSLPSSNLLFSHIKTPYFSFIDGDDYWLNENRLQKQVDFLDAHPEYTMVAGNSYYLRNEKKAENVIKKKYLNKSYSIQDSIQGKCPFVHTSSILLRNVIYCNGMPEDYIKAEKTVDNLVYTGENMRFITHLEKGLLYLFDEEFSVYRIHNKGIWSSLSENEKRLETCISCIRFISIFPLAKERMIKDFLKIYPKVLNYMQTTLSLSDKEITYLMYLLPLLQNKETLQQIEDYRKKHTNKGIKNKLKYFFKKIFK